MFQIGDLVMYGIHGVCTVTGEESRQVDRKTVQYFVLTPQDQPSAQYLVPMHNEAALKKLRRILSKDELEALLRSDAVRENVWISDENRRKQRYRELISQGDRTALLQMIRSLHLHRREQEAAGRKLHQCDDNFLRDAHRLIESEFSLILGLEPKQVGPYLNRILDET